MIVQITMIKNEIHLLREMMPVWKKYADGFVFMDDDSDDGTYEFLLENKEKYNIFEVLRANHTEKNLIIESNVRQKLLDEALKYSGNIICLDADEYLDGTISKEQLEEILNTNTDTLFFAQWIQYTGKNEIRVDGPWGMNFKDRIASYRKDYKFKNAHMHSEHLPNPGKTASINPNTIFIAHLQWLDKETVAVKQYFWKIVDQVNKIKFNANIISPIEYDNSVNNFEWKIAKIDFPLKIREDVYKLHDIKNSFKYKFIKENIKKYNIPNLNDWGMNIHE